MPTTTVAAAAAADDDDDDDAGRRAPSPPTTTSLYVQVLRQNLVVLTLGGHGKCEDGNRVSLVFVLQIVVGVGLKQHRPGESGSGEEPVPMGAWVTQPPRDSPHVVHAAGVVMRKHDHAVIADFGKPVVVGRGNFHPSR